VGGLLQFTMATIESSSTSGSTPSIRIDVGPRNVDVEKSKKKRKRSGTRGSGHRRKDHHRFFSRQCLNKTHTTIVNWFTDCSENRLRRMFLSSNVQGVEEYKRHIEKILLNEIFGNEFVHEKNQLGPERFQSLISEEVRSATGNLKIWVNQIVNPADPNYVPLMDKVTWFDSELSKLVVEPRRLVQGINKDLLNGSLLHFKCELECSSSLNNYVTLKQKTIYLYM
jgi:hypothetical protein